MENACLFRTLNWDESQMSRVFCSNIRQCRKFNVITDFCQFEWSIRVPWSYFSLHLNANRFYFTMFFIAQNRSTKENKMTILGLTTVISSIARSWFNGTDFCFCFNRSTILKHQQINTFSKIGFQFKCCHFSDNCFYTNNCCSAQPIAECV